jgi:N-methylhydantoinase A/oxoprolinase/acetone carboxylase beta subunit
MHAEHRALFGYVDSDAVVEVVAWRVRTERQFPTRPVVVMANASADERDERHRQVYFPEIGTLEVPVHQLDSLPEAFRISGPAIVESPFAAIVLLPGTEASRLGEGALVVDL